MPPRSKPQSMDVVRVQNGGSKSNVGSSSKQYQGTGPIKRAKAVEPSSSGSLKKSRQKPHAPRPASLRPFKFCTFPPEIRNIIYHQMVEDLATLKVRDLTHDHFDPPVTRSSAKKLASAESTTPAPKVYGIFAFLCTSKQVRKEFEPSLLKLPVLIELGTPYLKMKINQAYDEKQRDQATMTIQKISEHNDILINFDKMVNNSCSYSKEAADQMKGLLDVLSDEVPDDRLYAKLPRVAITMNLDEMKDTRSPALVSAIDTLGIFIPSLNIGFAIIDTVSRTAPRPNWRILVHQAYDRLTDNDQFVTVQDDAEDRWRKTGICKEILMRI